MGSISTNRRDPSPQADWFAQNNVVPTYTPGPNQAMNSGSAPPSASQPAQGPPSAGGREPTPDEVLAIVSAFPPTYEGAQAANAELQKRFGQFAPKLLDHPTKLDKWQFANGAVYDLMNSAGGPNASWVTKAMPEMPGGHGGGGGTLGQLAGGGGIPGLNPMTDFMLAKVQQGMERGAAAKGTLLTGGFQKALGENLANYALAQAWQPAFNNNFSLAGLGLNAAQSGNANATSYGNNLTDLYTNQANANAAGTIGQANNDRGSLADMANGINTAANAYVGWQQSRPRTPTQPTYYPNFPGQQAGYWPSDMYQGPIPT